MNCVTKYGTSHLPLGHLVTISPNVHPISRLFCNFIFGVLQRNSDKLSSVRVGGDDYIIINPNKSHVGAVTNHECYVDREHNIIYTDPIMISVCLNLVRISAISDMNLNFNDEAARKYR